MVFGVVVALVVAIERIHARKFTAYLSTSIIKKEKQHSQGIIMKLSYCLDLKIALNIIENFV